MNLAHAAIMAEAQIDLGWLYRLEDPNELVFAAVVIERVQDTRRAINAEQRREIDRAKRGH